MQVIRIDNLNRETEAESFVMGSLTEEEANALANVMNSYRRGDSDNRWYTAVPNERKVWRGMADLVGDPPRFDVDDVIQDVIELPQVDSANNCADTEEEEGASVGVLLSDLRRVLLKYAEG